jgi:hypothetical protein
MAIEEAEGNLREGGNDWWGMLGKERQASRLAVGGFECRAWLFRYLPIELKPGDDGGAVDWWLDEMRSKFFSGCRWIGG